ncbi:MAG: AMP-binding protein, partial [Actinomycetota bacterium]
MTAAELGVAAHARANPGKPAVVAGDRRITYAELDARANQAARAFRRLGVREGDRVAVALRNRPEFLEAATAAARLGAIVIPLSWRFKRDEVRVIVEDADAKLVVAERDAHETMEGFPALHLGGPYEEAIASQDETPPED